MPLALTNIMSVISSGNYSKLSNKNHDMWLKCLHVVFIRSLSVGFLSLYMCMCVCAAVCVCVWCTNEHILLLCTCPVHTHMCDVVHGCAPAMTAAFIL